LGIESLFMFLGFRIDFGTTFSLLLFMHLLHASENNFLKNKPWDGHRNGLDESVLFAAPSHGVTTAHLVQHTFDCNWRVNSWRSFLFTHHFSVDGAALPRKAVNLL